MSDWLLIAAGLTTLVVAAELLVRGSVWIALQLGVTPLVVGLTLVAFGTSAPELVVSLGAALQDRQRRALLGGGGTAGEQQGQGERDRAHGQPAPGRRGRGTPARVWVRALRRGVAVRTASAALPRPQAGPGCPPRR